MPLQPLLPNSQRDQISAAIEKAGFDREEFDLKADGHLVHSASGSRLAFHQDRTWRFLGHCFVADGPKLDFDRSWIALMHADPGRVAR
jgi:hypothetical protein